MKIAVLAAVLAFVATPAVAYTGAVKDAPAVALHGAPKYAKNFPHLDYVNPDAPKGGQLRLGVIGAFDNVNPYILKGDVGDGLGGVFETLMEKSLDEPFSQYGLIAESITIPADQSWVEFTLRPQAKWHDGKPITADDVVWSFEALKTKGHPFYRSYYKEVTKAQKKSDRRVRFVFARPGNRELPLIMGELPVLPKHYWTSGGRDFGKTTLEPIPGSGPYRIESVSAGRSITYKRVDNWWGKDLPINRGRYNFDTITYDYYQETTVALEAFFAGRFDVRQENVAKEWATAYTAPAVKDGRIVREEIRHNISSGMQAFIMNTRRDLFKDPRVRQALSYAFDFEWSNKNFAFGTYKRTNSYFENSELAARGLPTGKEKALLEKYRGKIPPEVLTKEYKTPVSDGSGQDRTLLRQARQLLEEAGWTLKKGVLVNAQGQPFQFEILDGKDMFQRWVLPFIRNLERLGIKATFRVVDSSQYQNRINKFDFDMTMAVIPQSLSPGNEQLDFWGSSRADIEGSRNLIGVRNPVVDDLIDRIITAPDRESLIATTHVLDRVLLWSHYVIPHWHTNVFRLAYWNTLAHPKIMPKYGLSIADTWWVKTDKK